MSLRTNFPKMDARMRPPAAEWLDELGTCVRSINKAPLTSCHHIAKDNISLHSAALICNSFRFNRKYRPGSGREMPPAGYRVGHGAGRFPARHAGKRPGMTSIAPHRLVAGPPSDSLYVINVGHRLRSVVAGPQHVALREVVIDGSHRECFSGER